MIREYGIDINPLHAPKNLMLISWQEILAEKIFADTGNNAIKSVLGVNGWNIGLIEKMKDAYSYDMLPGGDRVLLIKSMTGAPENVIRSFINHVNDPDVKDTPRIDPLSTLERFLKDVFPIILIAGGAVIAYSLAPTLSNITLKRGR